MGRQQEQAHRLSRVLIVLLVAGAVLVAGAWLGGWRLTDWRVPAIHKPGSRQPGEEIGDSERQSLNRLLNERGAAGDD